MARAAAPIFSGLRVATITTRRLSFQLMIRWYPEAPPAALSLVLHHVFRSGSSGWHNGGNQRGLRHREWVELVGEAMNIQFVRLEHDVVEEVNRIALESRRTVSDLVNEIVRRHLQEKRCAPPEGAFSTGGS